MLQLDDPAVRLLHEDPSTFLHVDYSFAASYASPEQVHHHAEVSRPTDIWSLGCVLYELTSFALPFTGVSSFDLSYSICTADPPPSPSMYSTDWRSFVLSLLRKHAVERPPISHVLERLERHLDNYQKQHV